MSHQIQQYMHCHLCLQEKPEDTSPMDWARLSVGFTQQGLQVWCDRHEKNVVHIDFEGQKHPADMQDGTFGRAKELN